MKSISLTLSLLMLSFGAMAKPKTTGVEDFPLLVIGASYGNASTPFHGNVAPLGGSAVNFGAYLSLGAALTRSPLLPGFVINEAQAGATTFARQECISGAPSCGPAKWDSYQEMLNKAVARVALPPTFSTYNAKFVVVTMPNDCLHASAFNTFPENTSPCTLSQLNTVVDNMIAVGQSALAKGITPIFGIPPRYKNLDLNLSQSLYGFLWVINAPSYRALRQLIATRIPAELPQAVVMNYWRGFTHIGDGLHPNKETAEKAAHRIAKKILTFN